MQNTFFWHDYETFGAIPRSDRPAQFAGIRTDMDLNEIGEAVMLYCKPALDTLPSPEACLITGITPQHCKIHGFIEKEFAAVIERQLAAKGTIGVGYNSIRFDDEVTRFLFWRNLIDPYAREWQNECSRWDLLDVVRAMYAFRPDSINWPKHDDGSVSFKLEHLSVVNGLHHDKAHDALSDVYATIGLARLIKKIQPKLFDFCLNLRSKDKVRQQLSLDSKRPLLHVSSMYGVDRACFALVWPLAEHPTNKNEVILWDLAADPSILENLGVDEIKTRLFKRHDDLPKDVSRLPIKTIAINKSPFVMHDLRVLTAERAAQLNINFDLIHRYAEVAKNLHLPSTLWRDVYQKEFEDMDVDEDLYGQFVPKNDRNLLNRLRTLGSNKLALATPKFEDHRLDELFFRYRARNFPESLNDAETVRWRSLCATKINQKIEHYFKEIDRLDSSANEQQKTILADIRGWLDLNHN